MKQKELYVLVKIWILFSYLGLNDMMEKDQKNTPGIEENMDGANEKGAIGVKGENGTANSIEMERLVKKEEINVEV